MGPVSSGFGASLTARPSVAGAAVSRMPVAAGIVLGGTKASTSSTSSARDSRCDNILPDQMTTARCIQRYMACLKQDTVCGEHFESCGTKNKFNQKKIFCQERLLACPDEGIAAIFGMTVKSATVKAECDGESVVVERNFSAPSGGLAALEPQTGSMLEGDMDDGALWLADNAATACVNVVDGCIRRACEGNAFKCISSGALTAGDYITVAGAVTSVAATSFRVDTEMVQRYVNNMIYDGEQVKKYIQGVCETDIGTNQACYMVVNGNVPKNDSWLTDTFEIQAIYNDMVQTRMGTNKNKILEWLAHGIGSAITSCKNATSDCVKTACGSGSLAACYGMALDGGAININNTKLGEIIEYRCSGQIVNNQSCKDLLVDKGTSGSVTDVWKNVWGDRTANAGTDAYNGKFGLVGQLNNELSYMFSEAIIRDMFTQCRDESEACVRRECGSGFTNCYINDQHLTSSSAMAANSNYGSVEISNGIASATANAAGGFDEVMARNLCIIPIKRSLACQNYFDIEYAKNPPVGQAYSWAGAWGGLSGAVGSSSGGWSTTAITQGTKTTEACSASKTYTRTVQSGCDASGENCTATDSIDIIAGSAAAQNCATQEAAIFGELIADVAATATAKLTLEQNKLKNQCESRRGQMASADNFIWAERPSTIPDDYSIKGLGSNTVTTGTPNLWGAFCQVKVSIMSTDPHISEKLSKTSAYFSLGDAVMCGSWITQSDLNNITASIKAGVSVDDTAEKNAWWIAGAAGALLGAVGGGVLGNKIGTELDDNKNAAKDNIDMDEIKGQLAALDKCADVATGLLTSVQGISENNCYKMVADTQNGCKYLGVAGVNSDAITLGKVEAAECSQGLTQKKNGSCDDISWSNYKKLECTGGSGLLDKIAKARQDLLKAQSDAVTGVESKAGRNWGTAIGAIGGAALGGAATGLLAHNVARIEREVRQKRAKDAAVAEWFENVGSKIQCAIGGKPVGYYGDVIEIK